MATVRTIKYVIKNQPTMEGAGVRLNRVFGYYNTPQFDPFLLLDDFGSDNPNDYLAGFPWHPHRGIETVTYMLEGMVEHGDSLGNLGTIESGDIQWMTAGSGIVHQEMPKRFDGRMRGFQLWVNLPASHKMMEPRYRDIKATDIPEVNPAEGIHVKVVSGKLQNSTGPTMDLIVNTTYLDITQDADTNWTYELPADENVFAYVVDGKGQFDPADDRIISAGHAILFHRDGDTVQISANGSALRYLLIAGRPLNEPIAWRGPIVMNTDDELVTAFAEYRDGTFIRSGGN